MSCAPLLSVYTLGGCSIVYEGKSLDFKTVSSKSIWTLLQYLIRHRGRTVTNNELIERLYPEDKSDQPQSALKTLVHRARERLNQLGYLDGKEILGQRSGGYFWNSDIPISVDVEKFEALIQEAAALDGNKKAQLQLRLEAVGLYKGDFLPDFAFEAWVLPISSYYRYLYVNTASLCLEELTEGGQYGAAASLAQSAIAIEPYEERLYYYLILTLIHTNQISAAKAQYEDMAQRFYSEFGVTPSDELQELYKKLLASRNGVELDLNIIKAQMREAGQRSGAFYCEYEFFKDVYRLEVRSAARRGAPIHICLMNISGKDEAPLSKKVHSNVMKKLSESIQAALRSGDVYSRYSVSQYVILLPNASYENSQIVLERILRKFRQNSSYPQAEITYSIQMINAEP